MNRWEDTVLTDKGAAFHSKLANGQTLKITRVMTGAAKVPVVNLRQQTGVTDEGKQRFEESYEFFSIISSRLWKGLLPTMEKNYHRWHLFYRGPSPTDITSIFHMIGVRHSKSRTEIMWKMS